MVVLKNPDLTRSPKHVYEKLEKGKCLVSTWSQLLLCHKGGRFGHPSHGMGVMLISKFGGVGFENAYSVPEQTEMVTFH